MAVVHKSLGFLSALEFFENGQEFRAGVQCIALHVACALVRHAHSRV